MPTKLKDGYISRSKSDRAFSVPETIRFASGSYQYELQLEAFELPDSYIGWECSGLACDGEDNIFAAFRGPKSEIAVFNSRGAHIKSIQVQATIKHLHSISLTEDESILLTDSGNHVVYRLSSAGEVISILGTAGKPSDTGIDPVAVKIDAPCAYLSIQKAGAPFHTPTKSVASKDGAIYVSDGHRNAAVHHFSPAGKLIASWGGPGEGPGEFNTPHSIAIDEKSQMVLIADRDNDRVQRFDMDGQFIDEITGLLFPVDLCVSGDILYILERDGRVSLYSLDNQLIAQLGYCGSPFMGKTLCVNGRGDIYISMEKGPYSVVKLIRCDNGSGGILR